MWPNRASNPGPLTPESVALVTVLCGPAPDITYLDMPTACILLVNDSIANLT